MTVEEIRGILAGEDDQFPVGMRVLAVDDDPTCLKLLECLLRKCHYHVTTTSQAKMALKMLREDRNRFELIISDVHMPDMDGFKLLELVGLEMDLPVIMLSVNSDRKLVMKGITHGACDYLVKPVRIEELRNIWQHVIRRKKSDSKHQDKSTTQDKAHQGEGRKGAAASCNADPNGKPNRKRKDEEEEEDGDDDDDEENEDPATHKKPRVAWSIELHRKFVSAVNQLGIEKSVPKRILGLMNVEGLSRENVASHLQKYRLSLKKISSVATQQANIVAALGGTDVSYFCMNSPDGLGDFGTLAGLGTLLNPAQSLYQTGGVLGRLTSPAGVSLRCLPSTAAVHPHHGQNLSNSVPTPGKLQPFVSLTNHNASLFQGIPTSLEIDQFRQNEFTSCNTELDFSDDPASCTYSSTFSDTKVAVSSSSNYLPSASSNPLILQGNPQPTQSGGVFSNHSFKVGSINPESINAGFTGSNLPDNGKCNENMQSTIQPSSLSQNPVSSSEHLNHDWRPPNTMRNKIASTAPRIQNSPLDHSSTSTISGPLENLKGAIRCQQGLVCHARNMNYPTNQRLGGQKQDYTQNSNHRFITLNSMIFSTGPLSQSFDQHSRVTHRKNDTSLISQPYSSTLNLLQRRGIEKSAMDSKVRSNEGYLLEQRKSQGGFIHNGYNSLDDMINAMNKQEREGTMLTDVDFGFDPNCFGSYL